MTESAFDITYR